MTPEEKLPTVIDAVRLPAYCAPPLYTVADEEPSDARIPLSQYLWLLRRHRWKIGGFIGATVLATWIVSARLTPVYESTATVDIDRQIPTGVVGQDAAREALNDADQFLATQMRLVQSDSVLRPVEARFHLRQQERQPAAYEAGRGPEAPVVFKRLKVSRPPNTYLIQIGYQSENPQLAADAANAIVESYLEHIYNIRIRSSASLSSFMRSEIEELKATME